MSANDPSSAKLFVHTPATRLATSVSRARQMLRLYHQDQLTGIIGIDWAIGMRALLPLVNGEVSAVYRLANEELQKLSPDELLPSSSQEKVTFWVLALPLDGVQTVERLLEWFPAVEQVMASAATLSAQLEAWGVDAAPGIVHVAWPDAEAIVPLPGGALPTRAIFMTTGQVESSPAGLVAIYAHPGQTCTLSRYISRAEVVPSHLPDLSTLRRAFTALVEAILKRYTELVGKRLAQSLVADLNAQSQLHKWNVTVRSDGSTDAQLSGDLKSATRTCQSLLREIAHSMSVVIGQRLVDTIFLETADQLSTEAQMAASLSILIPSRKTS